MKQYHFSVIITQDDETGMYTAKVPELPGCHTQAKSIPALYKRIQEVVELCIEVKKIKSQDVPQEKFIGVQQIEVSA